MINGILLCSGFSSRMGRFKPLLRYNGETFCVEIIRKLKLVCSKVVVVTGYNSLEVLKELENKNLLSDGKVITAYNSDFAVGMFTSMQTGIKALNQNCWALMHMVDQPNLPDDFYSELITYINDDYDWIQPSYNSRKGHPILFNSVLFNTILTASKDSTLRTLFTDIKINRNIFNSGYPQILTDIDTPEDYFNLINNPEQA